MRRCQHDPSTFTEYGCSSTTDYANAYSYATHFTDMPTATAAAGTTKVPTTSASSVTGSSATVTAKPSVGGAVSAHESLTTGSLAMLGGMLAAGIGGMVLFL
jgi:hypothetical protein